MCSASPPAIQRRRMTEMARMDSAWLAPCLIAGSRRYSGLVSWIVLM